MIESYILKFEFRLSWRPPRNVLRLPEERHQRIREMYNIVAEGDDIPPPLCRFEVRIDFLIHYD